MLFRNKHLFYPAPRSPRMRAYQIYGPTHRIVRKSLNHSGTCASTRLETSALVTVEGHIAGHVTEKGSDYAG